MLPAPRPDGPSLADVLKSCLATVSGGAPTLPLSPVRRAIVLLIDGLGADQLKTHAGHARTLAGALGARDVIESGFPTTTASALASLTTGTRAGTHGLVGYSVLDPQHDRVVNQLTGWDDRLDPATWQRHPTLFERAVAAGLSATVIGPERYRESGFTSAVLRGARYLPGASIADRLRRAAEVAREPGAPGIVYVYVPELDMAAHAHGVASDRWLVALEAVDAAARDLVAALPRDAGLLVTADHGVLDVPASGHLLIDGAPELLAGIRHIAGEPRCLQLHFEPDLSATERDALVALWREAEQSRAWVATRAEVIESGWLGPVDPAVEPRLGDLFVAARKAVAYYDGRTATPSARAMVGQHGSLSPAELRVPLLRFGAFA